MTLQRLDPVAKQLLEMDHDVACLVLSAVVYDTLPPYIEANAPQFQQSIDRWVAKRFDVYEQYLKRQYVERVQKNEDTSDLDQLYAVISKASFDDRSYEWTAERERLHPRDARGRFRDSPYRIKPPIGGKNAKPIKNPKAAGIPDFAQANSKLKNQPQKLAALQSAYLQVFNTLDAYEQAGMGEQKFSIKGPLGTKVYEGLGQENVANAFDHYAKMGSVPTEFKVVVPATTVGGVYFDALSAVTPNRDVALGAYSGGRDLPENIKRGSVFDQGWFDDSYAMSDNEPRFRRLKSGAELVDTFVPANAFKTKAALAGAKYVGELGPDAERIVGPTARKITYRSRGTERKTIDEALLGIDPTDRKRAVLGYGQAVVRGGKVRHVGDPGLIPQYFIDRLPNKSYWELQRKSGAVPPSEGVIIDSTGTIITQAVGFKDDHYLPFPLKPLAKLRGGEYVRTRSVGGPTTEDVYTALISGATAFTVVSRSGTFTLEFDETFKGRRRYNDKAGKMVERYGKLLDAANSGEVTLHDVDPTRYDELEAKARQETLTPQEYDARLKDLLARERHMPTPSEQMKSDIRSEIRQTLLEESRNGGTDFANRYNAKKLGGQQLLNDGLSRDDLRRALDETLETEINARYPRAVKEAMAQRSFKAMQLDGEGYYAALQALKEQYPYYIKNVHFFPSRDVQEKDRGYVKPRFLRPDAVWEGYFDPSIKGTAPAGAAVASSQMARESHRRGEHGKIPASRSNYQNYKYTGQPERDEKLKERTTVAQEPQLSSALPKNKYAALRLTDEEQALIDAYKATASIEIQQGDDWVTLAGYVPDGAKVWGSTDIDPTNLSASLLPRLRTSSQTRSDLLDDLKKIRALLSPGKARGYEAFTSALNKAERSSQPMVELNGEDPKIVSAANPSRLINFPEYQGMTRPQLTDEASRSEYQDVRDEMENFAGESLDDKVTSYITRLISPEFMNSEMTPAQQDALGRKIEVAQRIRTIQYHLDKQRWEPINYSVDDSGTVRTKAIQ